MQILYFCGMGFIGQHFAELMTSFPRVKRVYLADLATARNDSLRER